MLLMIALSMASAQFYGNVVSDIYTLLALHEINGRVEEPNNTK